MVTVLWVLPSSAWLFCTETPVVESTSWPRRWSCTAAACCTTGWVSTSWAVLAGSPAGRLATASATFWLPPGSTGAAGFESACWELCGTGVEASPSQLPPRCSRHCLNSARSPSMTVMSWSMVLMSWAARWVAMSSARPVQPAVSAAASKTGSRRRGLRISYIGSLLSGSGRPPVRARDATSDRLRLGPRAEPVDESSRAPHRRLAAPWMTMGAASLTPKAQEWLRRCHRVAAGHSR